MPNVLSLKTAESLELRIVVYVRSKRMLHDLFHWYLSFGFPLKFDFNDELTDQKVSFCCFCICGWANCPT
jgi:hypothetical protein